MPSIVTQEKIFRNIQGSGTGRSSTLEYPIRNIITNELLPLVRPLAIVTSSVALEDLLRGSMTRWASILLKIVSLSSPQPEQEVINAFSNVDIEAIARERIDIFGEDNMERFVGAFNSLRALTIWLDEHTHKGGADSQKAAIVTDAVGYWAIQAQIAIYTLFVIVDDSGIPDWDLESITLLCKVADEYMVTVEDFFLGQVTHTVLEAELVDYKDVVESA